jgi:hypothetical protein
MESVREIMKQRGGLPDDWVSDLFADFSDAVGEGEEPEDALMDLFGLEPDYLLDPEIIEAMGRGFALRRQV